jgi:cytochrome c biogenesis protein CcmG, thiol:disulfide interchange protein DsbE
LIEEERPTDVLRPESPDRCGTKEIETFPPSTSGDGAVAPGADPDSQRDLGRGGPDRDPLTPTASRPTAFRPPRKLRSLLIGSAIAIALVVLLFVGLGPRPGKSSPGPVVAVGSEAPGFTLPSLIGSVPVDFNALGKDVHHPVILNFFASWCTPCRMETPLLAKAAVAEQVKGGPVRFVGVDVNDVPANALRFVQNAGIVYPVAVDQSFRVTSGLYGIYGLPQTFFVDPRGRVVGHTVGAVDPAELRAWMKRLNGGGA